MNSGGISEGVPLGGSEYAGAVVFDNGVVERVVGTRVDQTRAVQDFTLGRQPNT